MKLCSDSEPVVVMSAFIKSDLRKTGEYGDCFNQFLFDILSSLVDKSNEQVLSGKYCPEDKYM